MDDHARHPDDETLFDLVEGALDDARAELVGSHLARCGACAAFVQAAKSAAPALAGSAVEPMSVDAAERLRASVATAWRERVSAIAAAEAKHDSATPAAPGVGEIAGLAPITPPAATKGAASGRVAKPPRSRGRRLIPILAFVVLGSLAGASYLVGQQSPTSPTSPSAAGNASTAETGDTARDATASDATIPETQGAPAPAPSADAATGGATDGAASAAPAIESPSDSSLDETAKDAAVEAAPPPQSRGDDDFIAQERLCIATRDQAQLMLPEGRIPQQVVPGPLGTYLVCG